MTCVYIYMYMHMHMYMYMQIKRTRSYLMQNRLIMVYMHTTIAAAIATGAIGVTELRLVMSDVMRRHRRR